MVGRVTREEIQNLYIRTCRDSGWRLDYIEAAKLVGRVINMHPFSVYAQFADLKQMERIALGDHVVCGRV